MWLFTKCGFFSVTQSTQRRDLIQIRARREKDLQALKDQYPHLDRSPILETPAADYRFRIVVQRWKWETVAAKLTADIDYSNFKGKIAQIPNQRDKSNMLHDIWSLHHEYQERPLREERHRGHPELFRPHGDYLMDPEELDHDQEEPEPELEDHSPEPDRRKPSRKGGKR